ncbi:Cell Surface Protein [Aurantiacibacter gangjinensis]|nr:Cell Surface Protein [Aurantiacibacter gangjinensis]
MPPSTVTDILGPVVNGVVTPTEDAVNAIIATGLGLPIGTPLPDNLSIDVADLLAQAAAGDPVTLQVLDSDGNVVGPADQCDATADSFQLDEEGGIAIGGNRISGLGENGNEASAADIDAIAFGNRAQAGPGATGSIAIGADSSVTAPNSVAIGAGSTATRGPQAGSAGEFSVGAPGAERQITNVADGTAATDAANVGQVQEVADGLAALDNLAVQYDDATQSTVTLGGADGTTVTNVADGAVSATSSDAVNGSQLFATNERVSANEAALGGLQGQVSNNAGEVAALDGRVTTNTSDIAALQDQVGNIGPQALEFVQDGDPSQPSPTRTNTVRLAGAAAEPVRLTNVAPAVAATDAVNLGQLRSELDATLAEAQLYTDERLASLDFDLDALREDSFAGTAGALAVAGLPQAFQPGRTMVGAGVGHFRGETAFAVGASATFDEGNGVVKFGASIDTRGYAGVSGGVGFQF